MSDKPTPEETALWQRRLASQATTELGRYRSPCRGPPRKMKRCCKLLTPQCISERIVGTDNNRAHAAQLVAHVYALLGLANPASHYLAKSQRIFESQGAEDWEVALAHAVAANVAAAAKDSQAHREHYSKAVALINALPDAEDKRILSATLRVLPVPREGSSAA